MMLSGERRRHRTCRPTKKSYDGFQLAASDRHCPCPTSDFHGNQPIVVVCRQMTLHRLSLIVENIQLSVNDHFTIAIRLPTFDWCSAGTFYRGVLPAGGTCTFTPTDDFLQLDEMTVDMKVECQLGTYSAKLNIDKAIGETQFSITGSTVLYHEDDPQEVLLVTVILAADCIRSPSPILMTSTESQTDTVKLREASSQARPRQRNQKVETQERAVGEAALHEAVIRVLQINLDKEKNRRQKKSRPAPPPDPIQPEKQNLGWNVVPRLQKLSVLDQMINNRERLLEVLGNTVQHSEVRKKMEFIRSQRMTDKEWGPDGDMEINTEQGERGEDAGEEVESSDVTSDTTGTSSSQGIDGTSYSSSESSSPSSKESSARPMAVSEKRAVSFSSSIEDPFSPRPAKPAEKQSLLSPTSEYIKTLREDILRQRVAK